MHYHINPRLVIKNTCMKLTKELKVNSMIKSNQIEYVEDFQSSELYPLIFDSMTYDENDWDLNVALRDEIIKYETDEIIRDNEEQIKDLLCNSLVMTEEKEIVVTQFQYHSQSSRRSKTWEFIEVIEAIVNTNKFIRDTDKQIKSKWSLIAAKDN